MAVEPRRECGYRKVGGLYLVAPPLVFLCDRMNIPLTRCHVCGEGIKQSRGWTWVEPRPLIGVHMISRYESRTKRIFSVITRTALIPCPDVAKGCRLCDPPEEKAGLLWIGTKFYTVDSFNKEAATLGISKRVSSLPTGFKAGETLVYLASPKAARDTEGQPCSGVFMCFVPVAVEKIVTESQAKDEEEMDKLKKRGIRPVVVPDDDPDHQ